MNRDKFFKELKQFLIRNKVQRISAFDCADEWIKPGTNVQMIVIFKDTPEALLLGKHVTEGKCNSLLRSQSNDAI